MAVIIATPADSGKSGAERSRGILLRGTLLALVVAGPSPMG
jgi:hypothetical protein